MTTLNAYTAAYETSAIFDFSAYGKIQVTGAEAIRFLNGLITNDIATLVPNQWMLAAFPNAQGRIIALTRVLCIAPETFIFLTEPETYEALLANLTRFTYAGYFHVTDLTETYALISLQGAKGSNVLHQTFSHDFSNLNDNEVRVATFNDEPAHIFKARHAPASGFDVLANRTHAATLIETFKSYGAILADEATLETLRIEAAIPRYGADYTDQTIVLETGLERALSYTKGCYTGQEIIARIHYRGHVARGLVQVAFDTEQVVAPDTKLYSTDDKEAGRITSAAYSPRINRTVALAVVKYAYLARDTKLYTKDESDPRAHVAFVTSDFNLNI